MNLERIDEFVIAGAFAVVFLVVVGSYVHQNLTVAIAWSSPPTKPSVFGVK